METKWGSLIETELRNRIRVLLWAYAYEIKNDPIVPDHIFDETCKSIDLTILTGKYDNWFRYNFKPYTGMWIYSFPDKEGLKRIYEGIKKNDTHTHSGR